MDQESQTFFQPKNHADKVISKLTECYKNESLVDVVLIANGRRISAHRLVLSACSDYFAAMFTNDVMEAGQREVTLQGIDGNALSSIITYMYTGSLSMQAENIEDILTASCMLQLSEVIDSCSKFLVDHLHPSNCLGILQFADRQGCIDLYKVAHNYVMENFLDIIKDGGSEFLELSQEELMKLLSSDDVNIPTEETLFTAVIDWVTHDVTHREAALPSLLALLKLPLMSPDFLADQVEPNPLVSKCSQCQKLLMEALKYHLLSDRRQALQSSRTKPRKSTVGVLLAVGGSETTSDRMPSIEKYDLRTDRWQQIFTLNSRRLQFGVAIVDSRLFVVGGRDGLKTLNTVDNWDMHMKGWTQVASMANHRHGLSVITLEGPIYAIGGHDGWQYLNSVERWDMQSKKWSYVSPMNNARGTAAVAVLGSRIYVCGGRDGSSCLRSLETFDPHTNKWILLAPMHKRRGGLGLAALNSYLYAVGGHDTPAQSKQSGVSAHGSRFSCCERYDPLTDQWTMVAALSGPKDAVGVCILGDRLYCAGGYDGQKHLRDVETYDPSADSWTKVSMLTVGRAGACVVPVSYDNLPMARSLSTLSLHVAASSPKLEHRSSARMSMSYSEPRFHSDT